MFALARLCLSFSPYHCPLATFTPNPSVKLRNPTLQLPPELWFEIFQFATYIHREATIVPLDPFARKRISTNVMATNCPLLALSTRISLVSVCHTWRDIALPLLYRYVAIRSPSRANALLHVLRSSCRPSGGNGAASHCYGHWTRHIEIYTHARGAQSLQYLQTLFQVLRFCPNLHVLTGAWNHDLPIEFLNGISRLFGQSLEHLSWSEPRSHPTELEDNTIVSARFFGTFRNLRVLDLRNVIGSDPEQYEKDPPSLMPAVQDLIISTHSRSLKMAAVLLLPSLRNVTLRTLVHGSVPSDLVKAFLKAHGASLANVDLPCPTQDLDSDLDYTSSRHRVDHINPDLFLESGACPNLLSFSYPVTSPAPSISVHNTLRRIGLRAVRADALYPDKGTDTKAHLLAITPARFPSLETVCTVGFLVEADMDSLVRDVFIWWVERFERLGIDFLDGEGVHINK